MMMMNNISSEDKEKAGEILRLFSELSENVKPAVLAELALKKDKPNRGNDMEIKL